MALVETKTDRKRDILTEIVIWLYIHDGEFATVNEWRRELIKMLQEVI